MQSSTNYQIRLSSRRLSANQSQVKFTARNKNHQTRGHLLLKGNLSLREVVEIIAEKAQKISQHQWLSPQDVCLLGSANQPAGFIYFES